MSLETQRLLCLGPFRLDPERRQFFYGEELVSLRPRVFETLLVLARHRGSLVTKEELLDAVWPDAVVEENNLNQNILALRRVFAKDKGSSIRIETLPRRGYRLIAPGAAEEAPRAPVPPIAPAPDGSGTAASPASAPIARRLRLAAALLAAVASGLALGRIWKVARAPRSISGVRSIAVLPLKAWGRGAAEEYLGLGLADAVITRLGYVQALSVRPTEAIRSYRDGSQDPVAAGRRLQVDAVLEGQIQRSGDRLRVTVQLIGTRTGNALWSEKLDVRSTDLFTIEDSISESVARALVSSLSAGETQRVGRDRQTSPEAYEAYLKGRYFWNQRESGANRRARELFERAIFLDPTYAPAYAGLADTLNSLEGAPGQARQAAEKALSLDDSLAEAYTSLGRTSLFSDWDAVEAAGIFRRAIDLNPSYATAHQWYAYCFLVRGDLPGALEEARQAQRADPLSPSIGVDLSLMLYYGRRYDDAVLELRRVLDLRPGFAQATQLLPEVLLQKGDLFAAKRECPPTASADPNLTNACLALVAAHAGDRPEAEKRLEGVARAGHWFSEALVALALGDRDRAMSALEQGYNLHDASLLVVGADPLLDDLHPDPRFARLLQRAGVTPLSVPPGVALTVSH